MKQTIDIAEKQLEETVTQEAEGIGCRLAVITCAGCNTKRALINMYKCLYCKIWFCHQCAEKHFGKTVKEYHQIKQH